MKNKESNQPRKSFINSLRSSNIAKGFRITYKVLWNLSLLFIVFAIMAVFFVGGAGAGFFASLVKDEKILSYDEMKKDIYDYEEISEVYFANDEFLGELPSELERREVDIDQVSDYLIHAVIATEDEYFFEHEGIVPKALMRATFQELSNSSVQTGGSTLTQQLIKNQILTSEVSFDRKAKEILLAMRLENFFEKEDILEAYLNVVPFGRNANGRSIAGVQAAAQGIFGVDVKDLSLPQAAYIAGLPQSPFGYTPFSNGGEVKESIQPSINRMKTVLTRMKESGYITEQEYEDALEYDILSNLATPTPTIIEEYPYLTYEVERRATEIIARQMIEAAEIDLAELSDEERLEVLSKYRQDARRDIRRKGYQIYTTIDKAIYDAMQEVVKDNSLFGPEKQGEPEEVGSILIENKTGAILSFVGGRDFKRENLNHATQGPRPNGSTMKPLLAYAPALEIGAVQPGFIIPDTPMNYRNGSPLRNFDNSHKGIMTAREALQQSRNIPAVKSFNKVPHEQTRDALLKMGIRNIKSDEPYEATSIGGLTYGTTVEMNTSAYTTFVNDGNYIESYMIEKITSKSGDLIFEHQSEPVEVFSPQTSYLILDMLRDVLKPGGTATSVPRLLKFSADWAGKTGTTNDYHDSWFVASNPNVTLGIWLGYDTPKRVERVGGLGPGPRTQRIWARLANAAYDSKPEIMAPGHRFEMPDGIVRQSVCGISGLLPSDLCREAGLVRTDLFNVKYLPTKVDDSLQRTRFVTMKGGKYRALDSTPDEFADSGVMIKESYLSINEMSNFIPEEWKNIVPDRYAQENGKTPNPVTSVAVNGTTLSWGAHTESDIVGYRVYRTVDGSSYSRVASIKSSGSLSYQVSGNGSYYVTAVDVAGNESGPSQNVSYGEMSGGNDHKVPGDGNEDQPDELDPVLDIPDEPINTPPATDSPNEGNPKPPAEGNNGNGRGNRQN
ncbi:transglycosylase domain-containing protein [Anaerobacillus sp. MEB173]|uniref:transglycosylase domain-containing protein n=1 Tax=Anaerobacillus sp. MEB173 TaxID=3383345 RepID=UPI003F8ECFBA